MSSESNVRLSVVLVTYNSSDHIRACIGDLHSTPDVEVIVVDNASSDDSVRIARSLSTSIRVIANTDNVGFAIAVNQAASIARGTHIALLNPDCRITTEDLMGLVDRLDADESVGIVAPAIVHPGGRLQVRSAGYEPTIAHMAAHAVGLAKRPSLAKRFKGFHLYPVGETPPLTSVDWVSGACLVMAIKTWRDLGGLSERWFMYAEDIDLCRRVRAHGLKVIHDSSVSATHEVGASSETSSGPVFTMWIESLADYYDDVYRPGRVRSAAWRAVVASGLQARGIAFAIRARRSHQPSPWKRESEKFFAYAGAVRRFRPRG